MDYCYGILQRLKSHIPDCIERKYFDGPIAIDIAFVMLTTLTHVLAQRKTLSKGIEDIRVYLSDLMNTQGDAICIPSKHPYYGTPTATLSYSTLQASPRKKGDLLLQTKSAQALRIRKDDKKLAELLYKNVWPGGREPYLEELMKRALPELHHLPSNAVIESAVETRKAVALLIDGHTQSAQTPEAEDRLRDSILDRLIDGWASLVIVDPEGRGRNPTERMRELLLDTDIGDIQDAPLDQVIEKIIAPARRNLLEAKKRVYVIEELLMKAVSDLDGNAMNRLRAEWQAVSQQAGIYECDFPSMGLVMCAIDTRVCSLQELRDDLVIR